MLGRGDNSKTVLMFGFCCQSSPSGLKVRGWVVVGGWLVAYSFLCQPQSLLVLDLIGTWLGFGQGGLGTKGLGTGLDNY